MGIKRKGEKNLILRIFQRENPQDLGIGSEETRGIIDENKVSWWKVVDTINGD